MRKDTQIEDVLTTIKELEGTGLGNINTMNCRRERDPPSAVQRHHPQHAGGAPLCNTVKAKNEKDQQLHGGDTIKDHL